LGARQAITPDWEDEVGRTGTDRPRQPWLHDLLVAVDGNATVLSGWDGDIRTGAEGLFVDDERVLSRLEVTLGAEATSPVAAEASGARSEFVSAARAVGDNRLESTVDLRRSRVLSPGRMCESVVVTSRAIAPVRAVLRLTLAADGAGVSAVVTGQAHRPPVAPSSTGATAAGPFEFVLPRHRTRVLLEPPPDRLEPGADELVAEYDLDLDPGGSHRTDLELQVERTVASLFDADPGGGAVDWSGVRVESDEPRLAPLLAQSLEDLQHLLLRDPLEPADVFAAAGSPWYLTLFGRDSIWTARMLLPFGTALAGGTLRALARRQGRHDDPAAAEQPGKIPHEVRRTTHDLGTIGISLPPLYYGTVDATALWVSLLVDAWRWGMPESEVRGLLPNLTSALGWLTGDGQPDRDGLLKYVDATGHGLANQGWKDSSDAMRHPDGSIAEGPIALVEAQAYAVEALQGAADLLDALGHEGSDRWRAEGAALAERVRSRYWVDAGATRHLAMALDGAGRPVGALGSNMGHVLGTGTLEPAEARQVAAALTSPDLLDRFGIRTLGVRTAGFNPIGYHTGSIWTHDTAIAALGLAREGLTPEAGVVARALLDAGEAFAYRLPELYSGETVLRRPAPYPASCHPQAWSAASAAAVVTVALGLRADLPGRTLTVRPGPNPPFGALVVEGIRFGDAVLTVAANRDGVVDVEGLPEDVRLVTSA
jgi:glycogen debranching enzyme